MQVFPRSYDSQKMNLVLSATEIPDELRDVKGSRKYCAIRNPGNAYFSRNNYEDNLESSSCCATLDGTDVWYNVNWCEQNLRDRLMCVTKV